MHPKNSYYPQEYRKDYNDQKPLAKYPKETELTNANYPVYQNIAAFYLPANGQPDQYFPSQNQEYAGIVMTGIVQGVPINYTDVNTIRIASQSLATRRAYWSYRRKVQNFICLNIFYAVVLVISINANLSDKRDYENTCPNYSRTNFFYAIISIISIFVGIGGIYGATKRQENILKAYIGGLCLLILLTVIATGYGLANQDDGFECESEPPKSIVLVGNGLFTIIILGLFGYTATTLRRLLLSPQMREQNVQLPLQMNFPMSSEPLPPVMVV